MSLPVITSDFMILVNNINENCGWVTKTKDAGSVRATLQAILALSPEELEAMKKAAREKAEACFSIDDMIRETDAVYARIMGKSAAE